MGSVSTWEREQASRFQVLRNTADQNVVTDESYGRPNYGTTPGGRHYPPAPSFASEISAGRQIFIELMDRTCSRTYNWMVQNVQSVAEEHAESPDCVLLVERANLVGVNNQVSEFKALGMPPDGQELYREWLANVEQRRDLQERVVEQIEEGDLAAAEATKIEMAFLKVEGNEIGQRFGFEICTSNGPGRSTVPNEPSDSD